VPKTLEAFKRDNKFDRKKSELDEEAHAILSRWGWVDGALYDAAMKIYAKKQPLAEKCMKLLGELDADDVTGAS